MSLQEKTLAALNGHIDPGSPRKMKVECDEVTLTCDWEKIESMACSFHSLRIESQAFAKYSMDQLKETSDRLAKRLTYLLEPVITLECDSEQEAVLMRSQPPARAAAAVSYYELRLGRPGTVLLCRYQKEKGQPRQQIPSQVTREVFGKLVKDLDPAQL